MARIAFETKGGIQVEMILREHVESDHDRTREADIPRKALADIEKAVARILDKQDD